MNPQPHVEITCHKRGSTHGQSIDSTMNTVRECQKRGLIQGVTVETWPDRIFLSEREDQAAVVEQYDTFRTWAETHNVSLEPAFDCREWTSLVNNTTETVLVLPILCFAVYLDDRLASVVPHQTGTDSYTTADLLADIEQYGRPREQATEIISPAD